MEHPRHTRAWPACLPLLVALCTVLLTACSSSWVRWEERDLSYTVKPGDTLYRVAFQHQLDHRDLAWWNGIGRDGTLQPGQILRLDPPLPGELRRPHVPSNSGVVSSRRPPAEPVARPSTPRPVAPAQPRATPRPASAPVVGPKRWQWPVRGPLLARFAPAQGRKGIDIGGKAGETIAAAADGKVVYAGGALKGYGELVIIKHGEDYLTAYGHNAKLLVQEGQQIKAGQAIATMGLGPQNRPLVHFEIRRLGQPVDPEPLLP